MSRTLVVGQSYPATVIHGTTRRSARAFMSGVPLPVSRRQHTFSEFGQDVLYVSEPDAAHQALMFGESGGKGHGGRVLIELRLRSGARILDVASEMVRAPAVPGPPIRFCRRPDFTDDMARWLNEARMRRGRAPLSDEKASALVDPTNRGFDRISAEDYPRLLVSYLQDRGYAGVRFTDETVLVDPSVVVGARSIPKRRVDEIRLAADESRDARGYKHGALYAPDCEPKENPPNFAHVNRYEAPCENCKVRIPPGKGHGMGRRSLKTGKFGGYTYICERCFARHLQNVEAIQTREASEDRFYSQVEWAEDGQGSDYPIAWFAAEARGLRDVTGLVSVAKVKLRSGEVRYVVGKQGALLYALTEPEAKKHLTAVRQEGKTVPRSRYENPRSPRMRNPGKPKAGVQAVVEALGRLKGAQQAHVSVNVEQKLYNVYMKKLESLLKKHNLQALSEENMRQLEQAADEWWASKGMRGAGVDW